MLSYLFPHFKYISQSVNFLTIHWAKTLTKISLSRYQALSSVSVLISPKVLYRSGKHCICHSFQFLLVTNEDFDSLERLSGRFSWFSSTLILSSFCYLSESSFIKQWLMNPECSQWFQQEVNMVFISHINIWYHSNC